MSFQELPPSPDTQPRFEMPSVLRDFLPKTIDEIAETAGFIVNAVDLVRRFREGDPVVVPNFIKELPEEDRFNAVRNYIIQRFDPLNIAAKYHYHDGRKLRKIGRAGADAIVAGGMLVALFLEPEGAGIEVPLLTGALADLVGNTLATGREYEKEKDIDTRAVGGKRIENDFKIALGQVGLNVELTEEQLLSVRNEIAARNDAFKRLLHVNNGDDYRKAMSVAKKLERLDDILENGFFRRFRKHNLETEKAKLLHERWYFNEEVKEYVSTNPS